MAKNQNQEHPAKPDRLLAEKNNYEEYLLLLQQRNRLLKKLRVKDDKQLELERKEQGFSLYLNGANVDLRLGSQTQKPVVRKTRTADVRSDDSDFQSDLFKGEFNRSRTAPSKVTRRGWDQASASAVKFKTQSGEKVPVLVPDAISGKYSEDFEVYESVLEAQLEEEEAQDENSGSADHSSGADSCSEGDTDTDEESDNSAKMNVKNGASRLHANLSDYEYNSSDEEVSHKLTFTVDDCKVLRKSLEADEGIRESIASLREELHDSFASESSEDLDQIDEEIMECDESLDDVLESACLGQHLPPREVDFVFGLDGAAPPERSSRQSISRKANAMQTSGTNLQPQPQPVIEMMSSAPKCRPVSSHQRKDISSLAKDDTILFPKDDLIAAIAEENRKIEDCKETSILEGGKRSTRSAPSCRTEPDAVDVQSRPLTTPGLTDAVLQSVTERVRRMTGRQQKKLLQVLAELEAAEFSMKSASAWEDKPDLHEQIIQQSRNDKSDASTGATVRHSSERQAPDSTSPSDAGNEQSLSSSDTENQSKVPKKAHRLTEHASYANPCQASTSSLTHACETESRSSSLAIDSTQAGIRKPKSCEERYTKLQQGLDNATEVLLEFKSNWGHSELIGLTEVQVFDSRGKLAPIHPGSVQIVSEHIYDCDLTNLVNGKTKTTKERHMWKCQYVPGTSLELMISVNLSGPYTDSPISHIVIWNYNKSIQDLNVGVKDCRIFVGTDLKWQGIIEKGCGNQVFEYGTKIMLNEVDTVQSDVQFEDVDHLPRSQTRTLDREADRSRNLPVIGSPAPRPASKPVWLDEGSLQPIRDTVDGEDIFSGPARSKSRVLSGRRRTPTAKSEPAVTFEPSVTRLASPSAVAPAERELPSCSESEAKPKFGRRSRHGTPDISTSVPHPDFAPKWARYSSMPLEPVPISSSSCASADAQELTSKESLILEQSFRSINNFNVHHRGRISPTATEECGLMVEPIKEKDMLLLRQDTLHNSVEDKFDERREELFEFPVLPRGQELLINIKSTWGDRHYVGLNGIEVFTREGELAKVVQIEAKPADINVLPEYEGDPRVVSNLIDRCYMTRDDLHLWLTPYTEGGDHFVWLKFEEAVDVAMIRIWNYNKSRIHSTRGARFIEMALDGKLIFIGEIARASGILSKEEPYGDTILFTTDEAILELVSCHDFTYEADGEDDDLTKSCDFAMRPSTADRGLLDGHTGRPFTCPKSRESLRKPCSTRPSEAASQSSTDSALYGNLVQPVVRGRELAIYFTETWGDMHYLGLTGLEVLGENFHPVLLSMDMLEAYPRDLNDLPEYDDDDRTLDKLINGINVTESDENMWMIPFSESEKQYLKIRFSDVTTVTGLRLWNYNKSQEDTFRGAKRISVFMDNERLSPDDGYLLRKGPGHCHFDFAQDILFNSSSRAYDVDLKAAVGRKSRSINLQKFVNEYETTIMPSGFVFQLKIFSSWGDPYYVGLNGIELYKEDGEKVKLTGNNITAYPHSVNIIEGVQDDVRTPDKLVDGVNDTHDGRHMWLAPTFPGQPNLVYVVFDQPVTISMLKLWNYSKTPSRGVRQFGLLVDDLLVYSGVLPQSALYQRAIVPGIDMPVPHHTILFTDSEDVVLRERKHILSSSLACEELGIQLTNDNCVLKKFEDKLDLQRMVADPALRPLTSVTNSRKPRL